MCVLLVIGLGVFLLNPCRGAFIGTKGLLSSTSGAYYGFIKSFSKDPNTVTTYEMTIDYGKGEKTSRLLKESYGRDTVLRNKDGKVIKQFSELPEKELKDFFYIGRYVNANMGVFKANKEGYFVDVVFPENINCIKRI